jgi:hypothetical protein
MAAGSSLPEPTALTGSLARSPFAALGALGLVRKTDKEEWAMIEQLAMNGMKVPATKIGHYAGLLLGFALMTALAGCGGGGASSAPAAGSGVSKGVITALGSIFVNGVEFSISSSKITANKSSGSDSDLRVGRVVTVRGNKHDDLHGDAAEVEYKDNLTGPLDLAPAGGSSAQILGQSVVVNTSAASVAAGKTVFRGFSSLSQLGANSVLEVSGLPDTSGVIHATYLELKGTLAAGTAIEIKGAIANLDTTAKTFTMNALTVNCGTAALNDLSGALANGMFVEVKGTGAGYTGGANPTLIATKIENEREDAQGVENHNLAVEGLVTGFSVGSNSFKVGGQAVTTGSLSLAGIGNNVRVEVEGTLVGGILVASKIKPDN